MILFTQGNGMTFFDVGLIVLAAGASIGSLATYRSSAIDGSPVANHVRAIKAVAWAVCVLFLVATIYEYGDCPISGVELVVLWLLAFSDIVSALGRIGSVMEFEARTRRLSPGPLPHQRQR
jgi:hypothetical protein